MNILQDVQDEYSRISGISLWICSDIFENLTEKSLTADFLGEDNKKLIDEIDSYARTLYTIKNTASFEYEGIKFLIRKDPFYNGHKLEGYAVAFIKEDCVDSSLDILKEDNCFFAKIVEYYYNITRENNYLKDQISKMKDAEVFIEKEKERLQLENDYDELTKVHSRSYFFKAMEQMDKDESLLPISVVVGDVNNLKFTNDMFGHRHGDWLLFKVAQTLQKEAEGTNYVVARCGGDEFFILMPNTQRSGANYYCKRVQESLAKENDTCLPPSISLGCAKKSEMTQSLNRLLEAADAKMYSVKSEFKHNQNQFEDLLEVLFARGFLTREGIEKKVQLVAQFAEVYHWDETKIRNCVNLVRYQDIGLCIVPERIFNKQEHTERERREIKKHPQLGMKIALISPITAPISDYMMYTHENYDGTGWPRKVSGEQIPKEVMLVRLVTEFVENEEKLGTEGAIRFIEENNGKIFEPQMCADFSSIIRTTL